MSIHFNLRGFRQENNILQSEVADLFGVCQSTLSRMEASGRELPDHLYRKLAKKYGEDNVSKYVGLKTVGNAMGVAMRRSGKSSEEYLSIIKSQQEEIARLSKRIDELTDLLLKK